MATDRAMAAVADEDTASTLSMLPSTAQSPAPRAVDRRARIRVASQHVTLGTFDERYIDVAVAAARLKKNELSHGARSMVLTDDICQQLREVAERAVRDAQALITDIEMQDDQNDLPVLPIPLETLCESGLPMDLDELGSAAPLSMPPSAPETDASTLDGAPAAANAAAPRLTLTQLEVAGMCCQSEVALVHKKLGTMEGVVDVKVNLMLRRVAVTHDAERASAARLLRALNWSLLGASLVDEQGASTSRLRRGTLFTREAALLATSFVLFAVAGGIWARPEGTP